MQYELEYPYYLTLEDAAKKLGMTYNALYTHVRYSYDGYMITWRNDVATIPYWLYNDIKEKQMPKIKSDYLKQELQNKLKELESERITVSNRVKGLESELSRHTRILAGIDESLTELKELLND